jgi:hypothetical protein
LAVKDVFASPNMQTAKQFAGLAKMWRNKNVQRAKPEHVFV